MEAVVQWGCEWEALLREQWWNGYPPWASTGSFSISNTFAVDSALCKESLHVSARLQVSSGKKIEWHKSEQAITMALQRVHLCLLIAACSLYTSRQPKQMNQATSGEAAVLYFSKLHTTCYHPVASSLQVDYRGQV